MNEFLQNLTPFEMVGILFAVASIAHIILGAVLRKIISHAGKTKIQWDDHLIKAMTCPFVTLSPSLTFRL